MSPPEGRRRGERAVSRVRALWRALGRERRRQGDVPDTVFGIALDATSDVSPDGTPESVCGLTPGVTPDIAPDAESADERRAALRSILALAEERASRAARARRPVLAHGVVVRVARGELAGRTATVVDADYIESRVLLEVESGAAPVWVAFSGVGAPDAG